MSAATDLVGAREARPTLQAPVFPSTPNEFITVMAHYHRAEIGRMAGWRDRIDRTTNWAITMVAAMLSISLSAPEFHHGVLLFGMVVIALLLMIEARRYRFFDVYRKRVRRLERNYYAQVLSPLPDQDTSWVRSLADDLRQPVFRITLMEAMSKRLNRNYIWIFLILFVAWMMKITTPKLQADTPTTHRDFVSTLRETLDNAAIGPLPGWFVLLGVLAFYAFILYAAFRREKGGEANDGTVHV